MVILDVAIVNVALPSMRIRLHFSTTGLQWVVNAYTITFAGFLMLGAPLRRPARTSARVPRRHGRCSRSPRSLCALAASRGMLIGVARAAGLRRRDRLARDAVDHHLFARPRVPSATAASAAWGAIGGLGASSGALLGGILTQAFGWPAIFAINVPLGVHRDRCSACG